MILRAVAAAVISVAMAAPVAADPDASAGLFQQMWPVLQHPRCMNCHTTTEFPRQGDDRHRHTLNVSRGPDDHGATGLHCSTCHQQANQTASGVPGAAGWHLAPRRMAWEGLSPGQLCRVLLDPQRGGLEPKQLVTHLNTSLVLWAWSPGRNAQGELRSTPPMPHARFVAIAREWVETGAACPTP